MPQPTSPVYAVNRAARALKAELPTELPDVTYAVAARGAAITVLTSLPLSATVQEALELLNGLDYRRRVS